MSLRASNVGFSHRKAPSSATRASLRPTSTYKSINSTSTIHANRLPNCKEVLLSTQSSYHTARARSSKYSSTFFPIKASLPPAGASTIRIQKQSSASGRQTKGKSPA